MRGADKRLAQVATTIAAGLALSCAPPLAWAEGVSWERLAGENRYETSAAISQAAFRSATDVVLASGAQFADALSAAALAGALRAPVLLTEPWDLGAQAAAEISRLGAVNIWIVGGEASVAGTVETALASGGANVVRIAGASRTATSVAVAEQVKELAGTSATVVVASGAQFADALSIAPYAYATASPVLLVGSEGTLASDGSVYLAEMAQAGCGSLVVCGGTASVSDEVEETLEGTFTIERLGGPDRYDTSRRIANWEAEHGLALDSAVVASGQTFPDALCGSALAGELSCPLLLAEDLGSADGLLKVMGASPTVGFVLGGEASVAGDAGDALQVDAAVQQLILDAAKEVTWPGPGLCAQWVSDVYAAADVATLGGDARDMYEWYAVSSRWQDLRPGMLIAVDHHPHTILGAIYGHVGIYVGDGKVRHSVNEGVEEVDLTYWLDHYGDEVRPRWGMPTQG